MKWENFKRVVIHYNNADYDILLKDGNVIEIMLTEDYSIIE